MSAIRSRGRGGTTIIPNWRLEDPSLDSIGIHIALWIASHAGDYREEHVTRNEIARRTGVGGPGVTRRLTQLVEMGIIELTQGTRGRFVITFDRDVWDQRPERSVPVTGTEDSGDRDGASRSTDLHLSMSEEQIEEQTEGALDDFFYFWGEYPRKTGKPAARRAFKVARGKADFEQIWSGTFRWTRYWREARTDEQFIPHPATWLNQERWNDPCPKIIPSTREKSMAAIERLAARGNRPVPTLEEAFKEIER